MKTEKEEKGKFHVSSLKSEICALALLVIWLIPVIFAHAADGASVYDGVCTYIWRGKQRTD